MTPLACKTNSSGAMSHYFSTMPGLLALQVILVLLTNYTNGIKAVKIALATQGRANEVSRWFQLISLMETKQHITFFALSYDKPVDAHFCSANGSVPVTCVFAPGSTWTSGRNLIAQSIYKQEVAKHHHHKYWIMTDHDQSLITRCGKSTGCHKFTSGSIEFAACCFDGIVLNAIKPTIQYPVIHYYTGQIEEVCDLDYFTYLHYDCGDAALYAYHRQAVPIMFPYIDLLDKKTWWESQGIHFHLVTACFPNYNVYSNAVCEYGSTVHTGYPQGRAGKESSDAIKQVYGKVGLMPDPINIKEELLEQGNCANLPVNTSITTNSIQHRNATFHSGGWQHLPSYHKCLTALKPRFMQYVETGDLRKIDGELY